MHKYTPLYENAVLKLEHNQHISNNDIHEIIASIEDKKYEHQGSVTWSLALQYSKEIPDKGRVWHALDLFVIHQIPGLLHSSPPTEADIIAHLQTSQGRISMSETVGLCLEKDTRYADKILTLLDDKKSILYRGLHTQRLNLFSKKEPTTMAFIRSECERARNFRNRY